MKSTKKKKEKSKSKKNLVFNKDIHRDLSMVVNHWLMNNEHSNEVPNVFSMLEQHNYSHVE